MTARPTLPAALVGDGDPVPCVDGARPPVPEPRRGGVDRALPAVAPAGGRLPALVLERASGRRLQVAAVHRGLRGGPSRRPCASPAAPPEGDDVAIICRNTTEAINHLAYRLRLAADDVVVTTVVEHHANLLPWARLCRAPVRRVRHRRHLHRRRRRRRPRRRAPPAAAGGHRRVERHRLAAADRRHRRRRPRAGVPGAGRRRPARTPPPAPGRRRLRGLERPQDVRTLRRRRADRPPGGVRRRATRSSPAAAPSTWSTSTRSPGPTRPTARRPARPT